MDAMGATSVGPPQIASGRVPAMVIPVPSMTDGYAAAWAIAIGPVTLDINPEKITIARSVVKRAETTNASMNKFGSINRYVLPLPAKITVSGIILEGMATKMKCDILLGWCNPQGTIPSNGIEPNVNKQQKLLFLWGPPVVGFWYLVTMDSVNVNYERFNPMGIPTRATLTLQMSEEYNELAQLPTNPTSGGISNRREHIVTQGENLQGIARTYFGSTGSWRPLAEINGINDPFRLRPGQKIFIPNRAELSPGEAK